MNNLVAVSSGIALAMHMSLFCVLIQTLKSSIKSSESCPMAFSFHVAFKSSICAA
jgi:hypothetical protein